MDYVNDRPEMRQLRDGRQVGTEMECMANVRACIALLRQHCQTSEAQRIIQNLEMACCSGKDNGSLRAKSRAVSGSDSGGARKQLAQASTKRCEFEAHVRDDQCDDALRDWQPVRESRRDKVEWMFEHMWHALYGGRIKVGARATIRKNVGYKQWDVHNRRIQDVTAEDVFRDSMQDEEVKEWLEQYPAAAKNVTVEGLRRNICWCYEDLKEARRGPSTTPQQDAAPRPRQRHSKQDTAPRQRHRLPKTFPLVTRAQGTRSTRRDRFRRSTSSQCRFCLYYPISIWFFSSFSKVLTHSPLHSSPAGSILAKLLKTQAYTRYLAPTRAQEPPKCRQWGNGQWP
jgi:hypothetical protein